jgi:hypothetical protein
MLLTSFAFVFCFSSPNDVREKLLPESVDFAAGESINESSKDRFATAGLSDAKPCLVDVVVMPAPKSLFLLANPELELTCGELLLNVDDAVFGADRTELAFDTGLGVSNRPVDTGLADDSSSLVTIPLPLVLSEGIKVSDTTPQLYY